MLKHVDEKNSEYPASAEYPILTKRKYPIYFPTYQEHRQYTQNQQFGCLGHVSQNIIHTLEDVFCFGGSLQIFTK